MHSSPSSSGIARSGARSLGGMGASVTTRISVASGVRSWKGGVPVRISYSSAPRAYTSERGPTRSCWPWACSGGMYDGVPTTAPWAVIPLLVGAMVSAATSADTSSRPSTRATPQSMTWTSP